MSAPRWLRQHKRARAEFERYPRRWVMPAPIPPSQEWNVRHDRLWLIPEPQTVHMPKRPRIPLARRRA